MNKLLSLSVLATTLLLSSCSNAPQEEPLAKVIDRGLKASTEQALLMAKELEQQDGRLPKSIKDGKLETSDCYWWCSGFFPGELWYLYENNPTPELKKYAGLFTERLEKVQHVTDNHDVGFMLYCSYGNGYRLTQNPAYKDVLVTGAGSLSTRFNPMIKAIRSWDFTNNGKWQYPVIIDNMMNLELLTWASKTTGDNRFHDIAVTHANTTMENHFRDDYSCYHVVSYDTITGKPHIKMTHQGYADESAWARGQAWAIYGYTMMARETGSPEYLAQAKHIARFLMNHPNMPADKVPYWDFDAPGAYQMRISRMNRENSCITLWKQLNFKPDLTAIDKESIETISAPAMSMKLLNTSGSFTYNETLAPNEIVFVQMRLLEKN